MHPNSVPWLTYEAYSYWPMQEATTFLHFSYYSFQTSSAILCESSVTVKEKSSCFLLWRCFLMTVEPGSPSIPTTAIFSQDGEPVLLGLWPHPGPDVGRGYCRDGWALGMAKTLPLAVLTPSDPSSPMHVPRWEEEMKLGRGRMESEKGVSIAEMDDGSE